jgi:glycosyltransferase involved in cell wall biosynthesis
MAEWHIITGEYPPQPGGVADYTRLVACGLASAGEDVHVWVPACGLPDVPQPNIEIHRLPGHFGRRALSQLDASLRVRSAPRRLLVQYVPHAFGYKAMNVGFCGWLYRRRRREEIWVMFHEVAYPLAWRQPIKHQLLGLTTRIMAALLARAARRIFVSTTAWVPLLTKLCGGPTVIDCLPVPSNVPVRPPAELVQATRLHVAPQNGQQVIGSFGTFGALVAPLVEQVLPQLLLDGRRVGLLIGRGGEAVRQRLIAMQPAVEGRLFATGELPLNELSAHIVSCDLLIQPFPDGVTTRRTSLMAGLACGVPVVTTSGVLTERFWFDSACVAIAPVDSPETMIKAAEALLVDSLARQALASRGAIAYEQFFSLDSTRRALLQASVKACAGS